MWKGSCEISQGNSHMFRETNNRYFNESFVTGDGVKITSHSPVIWESQRDDFLGEQHRE